MTNRELKKLSRADLIEMLIIKCRENEQLRQELEQAQKQAAEHPGPLAGMPDGQVHALFQAMKLASDQYFANTGITAEENT